MNINLLLPAFTYAPIYKNEKLSKENLIKNVINVASYIPRIGTIIGIAHIAFAIFSYARANNDENKLIAKSYFTRGLIELASSFGSGIVLLALDILKMQNKPTKRPTSKLGNATPVEAKKTDLPILKHAKAILPSYQNALTKEGKTQPEIDLINLQLKEYKSNSELYTGEVKEVFEKADFLIVHGAIHVSHVALLVPIMVNFYRSCNDQRAINISEDEITALQVAALYHDYGRTLQKNDIVNDSHIMETAGAEACKKHLVENGFDTNLAERMSAAIKYKDKTNSGKIYSDEQFKNKDIFAEILQNCDCIAYLRAHDASFNPKYLDVTKLLQITNQSDKVERLHQILDATKLFLISIGDSPDKDYKPLSTKYKSQDPSQFQGRINLIEKAKLEKSPDCFEEMHRRMSQFEDLK